MPSKPVRDQSIEGSPDFNQLKRRDQSQPQQGIPDPIDLIGQIKEIQRGYLKKANWFTK